tara:strand:- start:25 stop:237 length:213 start_codon:yes stop_codon:yes gene_type:complete
MKYVLVDKHDCITTSAELASNVGLSGAKTYFVGIKQIDEEEFDKLWRVMSEENYHIQFKASLLKQKWIED